MGQYMGNHLSGRPRHRGAHAAYPELERSEPLLVPKGTLLLLGLAPGGGYLAIDIAADPGGLLHHLFTLAPKGGLFLWPSPRITPPGCYPAPCSMERGLSSDSIGCPRLPGRPIIHLRSYLYVRTPSTVILPESSQ
jgi:hypothetical protein